MAEGKAKSSYQQELERKSNDLLRIYNPTDKRYIVQWDKRGGTKLFPVESKSEAVYPRYISEKYIKEMYIKMQNDTAREEILKENERRVKNGMAEMDKTMRSNEQMVFEEKFYNPSEEKAREIIALLYLGVESEFGVDRAGGQEPEGIDKRPVFEKALEDVQENKVSDTTSEEKTSENGSGEANNDLKCEVCGFVSKSNIGLISHKRTHRDELEAKKEKAVSEVSA